MTLPGVRAGNGCIGSLIRAAGRHQYHGTYFGKGKAIGFFARIGHEDELRLSCQTQVNGDIEVETQPDFNWHGEKFWN